MPDVSGPFDGSAFAQTPWYRDRGYLEPSGVQGTPAANAGSGDLAMTTAGLTSSLALGRAHVRGAAYERTGSAWTYAHPANTDPTNYRLDRVVLRRDLVAKTVVPAVLQGTPSPAPVGVALTTVEDGVWEELLHEVQVPPASGTVLSVFDRRQWLAPQGSGVVAFATEALANARGSVLAGRIVQAADTGAFGMWDAVAGRVIWYDTRWQNYTPTVDVNNVVTTVGNGLLAGRFYRKGREISVDFLFQLGTTTNYNGAAGVLRIGAPPGYRPGLTAGITAVFGTYCGTGRANGTQGTVVGTIVTDGATAAARKLVMVNAGDLTIQTTTGPTAVSATNHFLQGRAQYMTEFEA